MAASPSERLMHLRRCIEEGREAEAAELLEELALEWPDNTQVLLTRGAFHTDPEAARRLTERAVEQEPEDPWVLLGASHNLLWAGLLEDSARHLLRCQQVATPKFTQQAAARFGTVAGALARRQHRDEAAEPLLREALELGPDQVETAVELAGLYLDRGDLDAARDVVQSALALHPRDEALRRLAQQTRRRGTSTGTGRVRYTRFGG